MVPEGKEELLRHDADHGVRGSPDSKCPTDDVGVAVQTRLPEVVPDDNHFRRTDYLVRGNECPAE